VFIATTTTIIQFNSIQLFVIYVPSQQVKGQLQPQHSTDTETNKDEKRYQELHNTEHWDCEQIVLKF
jgi:hypothetical protein